MRRRMGGMGLILHHLTGAPYLLLAAASVVVMASMWVLPFKWIERVLRLARPVDAGLRRGAGRDPSAMGGLPAASSRRSRAASHQRAAEVRLFRRRDPDAVMFPYEAYFYSSGGIEEEWGPKDLLTNRVTTTVGFASWLAARDRDPRRAPPSCSVPSMSDRTFRGLQHSGGDPVRAHRPAARLPGNVVRGRRRGRGDLHGQCLCRLAILRLEVGPPQEAVGGTALHLRLDSLFLLALGIVMTGVDVMSLVDIRCYFRSSSCH